MRLRFGGILPRIACFRISIRFYNNHFPIERSASHSATSPIAYSAIRPAEDFLRFSQSPFGDSVRRSRTDCAVFSCSSFLLTEVLCLIPRTRVTRLIPAGIRRIVSGTVSRPFKTLSVRTISQFSQSSVSCSATLSFSDGRSPSCRAATAVVRLPGSCLSCSRSLRPSPSAVPAGPHLKKVRMQRHPGISDFSFCSEFADGDPIVSVGVENRVLPGDHTGRQPPGL